MEISIQKEMTYIPKWNGNDKSKHQFKAHIHVLTAVEFEELRNQEISNNELVSRYVKLSDFVVNGEAVADGSTLVNIGGTYKLVEELALEVVRSGILETDIKNE